jgi:Lon protease-like protein
MQPLHVFEPRYRQMTADALASDRLLTLCLLQPGWEADYDGRPAVYPVACVGKVVAEQRLDDGRYNLLLRGLARVRILEEVPQGKPYRVARVELLSDRAVPQGKAEQQGRRRLRSAVKGWFPSQKGGVLEQFSKLLDSDLPLGALCDILAFALPLEVALKQALLEQLEVRKRVRRLLDYLQSNPQQPAPAAAGLAERKFPPEFSAN